MTRLLATPTADLEFHSNGYKIISGKYRYFFGTNNSGVSSYTKPLILRLFDVSGTKIFEEKYSFDNPIAVKGGRSFLVDTEAQAVKFEFEHKDSKFSGAIGKLIEQIK